MQAVDFSLPIGSILGDFKVINILGVGGFGITYKAQDTRLERYVAIKEFLPVELAARGTDNTTVMPRTNVVDDYKYGLTKFLDEAKVLATFNHSNIAKIHTFLELNGTAYLVMEYVEGKALDEHLKEIHFNGKMAESRIREIIEPLLHGLAEVHKVGLLHRDIKPGNIYLKNNAQGNCEPMLLDFGAARQSVGEKSKSISAIISQGYAPPEQYTSRGKQGAYTDIYAVGAVMYYLVTGNKPVESTDRQHEVADEKPDPLAVIEKNSGYSNELIDAITQAMALRTTNRLKNVKELQAALLITAPSTVDTRQSHLSISSDATCKIIKPKRNEEIVETAKTPDINTKKKRNSALFITLALMSCIVIGGYFYNAHLQEKSIIEAKQAAKIEADKLALEKVAKIEADKLALERVAKIEADKLAQEEANILAKKQKLANIEATKVPLTITTSPTLVKIRLLTPASTYKKGMRLLPNRYQVELSKAKFITQKRYINLTPTKTSFHFNLELDIKNHFKEVTDIVSSGAEIIKLYHLAAEQGPANAQYNLGYMYSEGQGVMQSYTEAFKWYLKAAEQGNANSQNNLGLMYENGLGVSQSNTEAIKWYRKAAEQGRADSQNSLGYMYSKGLGIKQSYKEAFKWYMISAEQGYADSQNSIGYMYDEGQGVTQSNTEAIKWYRKSAEQGDISGQYNLGLIYKNGQGISQSYSEAVKWFRKAAAQGHANSQNALGVRYKNGQGVKQSYTEAIKWFRKAAEQGNANAQYNLGVRYERAEGVSRSYTEAIKWYSKAAKQGHAKAQAKLTKLNK